MKNKKEKKERYLKLVNSCIKIEKKNIIIYNIIICI